MIEIYDALFQICLDIGFLFCFVHREQVQVREFFSLQLLAENLEMLEMGQLTSCSSFVFQSYFFTYFLLSFLVIKCFQEPLIFFHQFLKSFFLPNTAALFFIVTFFFVLPVFFSNETYPYIFTSQTLILQQIFQLLPTAIFPHTHLLFSYTGSSDFSHSIVIPFSKFLIFGFSEFPDCPRLLVLLLLSNLQFLFLLHSLFSLQFIIHNAILTHFLLSPFFLLIQTIEDLINWIVRSVNYILLNWVHLFERARFYRSDAQLYRFRFYLQKGKAFGKWNILLSQQKYLIIAS